MTTGYRLSSTSSSSATTAPCSPSTACSTLRVSLPPDPLPAPLSVLIDSVREAADGHRGTNSAARLQGRVHTCARRHICLTHVSWHTSEPPTCQARACFPRVQRGALVFGMTRVTRVASCGMTRVSDRRQVAARAREPLDLPRVQLHDPSGVRLSGAQSPLQMHPAARRLRPVGQHGVCTLTCTLVPHRPLHAHSCPLSSPCRPCTSLCASAAAAQCLCQYAIRECQYAQPSCACALRVQRLR